MIKVKTPKKHKNHTVVLKQSVRKKNFKVNFQAHLLILSSKSKKKAEGCLITLTNLIQSINRMVYSKLAIMHHHL